MATLDSMYKFAFHCPKLVRSYFRVRSPELNQLTIMCTIHINQNPVPKGMRGKQTGNFLQNDTYFDPNMPYFSRVVICIFTY